ncbi:MAG: DUF4416 family protein [Gemmatimonadetes bacterium]|nr:DUF4416 family protein [Gemmatimonadota bacterium]
MRQTRYAESDSTMGTPANPDPVKLVCAIMGQDETKLAEGRELLADRFGAVELAGPVFDFTFSSYYEREMGAGLVKQFLGFGPLVYPEDLADIKRASNGLEAGLVRSDGMPGRALNIDPGYVNGGQLVLATTKNYSHRIYIGKGIFAEVTLLYTRGEFTPLPWTYRDYSTEAALAFFTRVRAAFLYQRGSSKNG